jgi:hypothetical protein
VSRLGIGVFGAALLLSSAAQASSGLSLDTQPQEPQDCGRRLEEARRERAESKLVEARDHFVACTEQCSDDVADACRAAATELLVELPTIVVDARDAEGNDLTDVVVSIDGATVARELDGKAIALNPGTHRVTLVWRGLATSETIVAKARAKAEALHATFGATSDPDGPTRDVSGHTVWPWAEVAVGAAIVVGGIAVVLTAPSLPSGCDRSSRTCTPSPSETAQGLQQRQDQAGQSVGQPIVGALVIGTGALVLGGALAWHFLESTQLRTSPSAASLKRVRHLAPWFAREGGGMAVTGTF